MAKHHHHDVPPCNMAAEIRARLWRLALLLNKRAARRGRGRPLTHATLRLLDWLLWHAPRQDGGLWHSEATMAERVGMDVRTVQRAKESLARCRLIRITPRWHAVAWPVRLGAKIHLVRKGMRTSDAIGFPDLRRSFPRSEIGPRHFAAEGKASFGSQVARGLDGRFLSAAVRRKFEEIAAQMNAERQLALLMR